MSGKDTERWKRLAALGAKKEIPTPEGEAKMSAVIIQLAEPLLKQHGNTAKRAEMGGQVTDAAGNQLLATDAFGFGISFEMPGNSNKFTLSIEGLGDFEQSIG
jgi:hypothetical protein